MKIFTLILSLFIMVMATLPCCLFDNCPGDKEKTEHTDGNHKEHATGDEDGCGSCSPFFACSSCSIAIDQPKSFNPEWDAISVTESKDKFVLCETHLSSSFFHSFWQPPKLG